MSRRYRPPAQWGPPDRLSDPLVLEIQGRLRSLGALSPQTAVRADPALLGGNDLHHLHLPGVLSEAGGRIWLDEARLTREHAYSRAARRWAVPVGLIVGALGGAWFMWAVQSMPQ